MVREGVRNIKLAWPGMPAPCVFIAARRASHPKIPDAPTGEMFFPCGGGGATTRNIKTDKKMSEYFIATAQAGQVAADCGMILRGIIGLIAVCAVAYALIKRMEDGLW